MTSPSDSRIEFQLMFLNKLVQILRQARNQGFLSVPPPPPGILSKRASGIPCYGHPYPLLYQKTQHHRSDISPGQVWNQRRPGKVADDALAAAAQGCPCREEAKARRTVGMTHEMKYMPAVCKWCRICSSRGPQISTPFHPFGGPNS